MLRLNRLTKSTPKGATVTLIAALTIGVALVACTTTTLTPASSAYMNGQVAIDRINGVRAAVDTDAWPSSLDVEEQLTPLHVTIENNSDAPIRIRYQEFALIGPQGQYFSALPPMAAVVDVEESSIESATVHGPTAEPSFRHRGFFIAPPYRYAYGDIPVWEHDYHHDSVYHTTYHGTYQNLNISADKLHVMALPEGVVEPGGRVSGFVYFEHVDNNLPRVQLRADLVNAETKRTVGSLSIPFTVNP